MDNDIFSALVPCEDQGDVIFNTGSSHMFSGLFMQPSISGHDTCEQIIAGSYCSPMLVQDELLNNPYTPNCHRMANGRPQSVSYSAEGYIGNIDTGTSFSGASLTNVLSSNVGSDESLFSINNSAASPVLLNLRSMTHNSFYSSYPLSRNCDYGLQDGPDQNDFLKAGSTVHPSFQVTEGMSPGWNLNGSRLTLDQTDNYLLPRNELSLSLRSCQPPIITQVTPKDSEKLSFCNGPLSSVHFSHVLMRSRYLDVAQKVLAEFVNYALEDSEETDGSSSGLQGEAKVRFFSSCSRGKCSSDVSSDEFTSSGEIKTHIGHQVLEEAKAKKTKLVAMLQMVDDKYNQCLYHIQNVVSTFHDATNSTSPHFLARFALQTVAPAFNMSRERISKRILLDGQESRNNYMRGKEKSFETSFVDKQWNLKKDQQSWRPQRGLSERSVSVLRSWMFQNFLHPYPKDNDKQLLALQSGLTRSQVSNWFINARVRIWKPMIEEMYCELRKHQAEEGIERYSRSHGDISVRGPKAN